MKIKVGCLTYTVKDMPSEVANANGIYGRVDHQAQIIYLQEDMSPERRREVLLHELLHSTFHQWVPDGVAWNEEMIVSHVGYGLSTIFRDNPKLKEILFDAR